MDYNFTDFEDVVAGTEFAWIAIIGMLVGILIAAAIQIGVCIWVYKNAKKNNVESPGLWVLLCLFIPFPIGLIVYIIVRNNNKKQITGQFCPACGKKTDGGAFCPSCGTNIR